MYQKTGLSEGKQKAGFAILYCQKGRTNIQTLFSLYSIGSGRFVRYKIRVFYMNCKLYYINSILNLF